MKINESIDTQADYLRLRKLVEEYEKYNRDVLRLKYLQAELKFYDELEKGKAERCIQNARQSEIAKLRAEREDVELSLMSDCPRERAAAYDRIERINRAISLIQSFLQEDMKT